MCQVPQEASSSVCVRQQLPQAVYQQPQEWHHGHADPEALEGADYPPASSQTLQETRAAAMAGKRTSWSQGQGRAGCHTGGGT